MGRVAKIYSVPVSADRKAVQTVISIKKKVMEVICCIPFQYFTRSDRVGFSFKDANLRKLVTFT